MKHISLETCKALKDAGMLQDSYFCYIESFLRKDIRVRHSGYDGKRIAACPTIDEMLEMLMGYDFMFEPNNEDNTSYWLHTFETGETPTCYNPAEVWAAFLLAAKPWKTK